MVVSKVGTWVALMVASMGNEMAVQRVAKRVEQTVELRAVKKAAMRVE